MMAAEHDVTAVKTHADLPFFPFLVLGPPAEFHWGSVGRVRLTASRMTHRVLCIESGGVA